MKAIITAGIPGSGKSSWAEDFTRNRSDWVEVNRDNLRFPDGNRDYYHYKFKKAKENEITQQAENLINFAAQQEKNIIVSDTNLNKGRRDDLVGKLETLGYNVVLKLFPVTLQEAVKRDKQREGGVGEEVILRMYIDYVRQFEGVVPYTPGDGELAYVFDIDGTVAKNVSRGWFDWDRVDEDEPNLHVIEIAKSLYKAGYAIVFLSGRDGSCYAKTKQWLIDHLGFSDFDLFMREAGDERRDSIIKMELFDRYIRDHYNVLSVVDDRPQVIKECWLPLGVNVISVGNPYVSF